MTRRHSCSSRPARAELDGLFTEMAAMGSFRLGLTGGEPLLRRDRFDITDLATSHGLHPCVTTNGLLITEEAARDFAARRLVWLSISPDGATAATNDRVRGAGTFDRVLGRIAVLRGHARFTSSGRPRRTGVPRGRRTGRRTSLGCPAGARRGTARI
jgi:MoaA/NifB/PqqE/SkfB family radical SAM enzyme